MIAQILQNLAGPGQLHKHQPQDAVFPTQGPNENLITRFFRDMKVKFVEARRRQIKEANLRREIDHLRGLTDEQLRDMGIARPDIAHVVRYGKDGD